MHSLPARVILVVVVAMIVSGCAGGHPRLVAPGGENLFGISMGERRGGVPFVLSDTFRVCLDRPGSVEITDVDLEYSVGGLRVDAFAVRPHRENYPVMETDGHSLWEFDGFEPGPVEVDLACDEGIDNPGRHLGVEVSKPTDATARGANLLVTYRSGGSEYTLRRRFELILCETDDYEGECAEWELDEYKRHS